MKPTDAGYLISRCHGINRYQRIKAQFKQGCPKMAMQPKQRTWLHGTVLAVSDNHFGDRFMPIGDRLGCMVLWDGASKAEWVSPRQLR